MRFIVTKACASGNGSFGGRVRAGALYIGGNSTAPPIETPSLLISTRKGLPAFISPDHLADLPSPDALLLHVSPIHLCFNYDYTNNEPWLHNGNFFPQWLMFQYAFERGKSESSISHMDAKLWKVIEENSIKLVSQGQGCTKHISKQPSASERRLNGLHQLVGLHDHLFIAATRDSIESLPESEGTNKLGASFETPSGRRLVKPSAYMEVITSLMPNLWASMADEVPAWSSKKRNRISVDRTLHWLDECLALDPAGGKNVLGFIVGGSDIEERKRCAVEVATRNVSGFWIGGFGLGDNIEERPSLLNAVTDSLPEEKVRVVSGLSLPEEVLQGVAAGVDLFDSTYIYHLSLGGFALIFPLNIADQDISDLNLDDTLGDCTKINLRATIYRKDTSPIVASCTCFTCQNHTRAYINHLLNVHEMLAHILLEIHNTHHYLSFFRYVREAIKCGEFDQFRQKFVESRRIHLTSPVQTS